MKPQQAEEIVKQLKLEPLPIEGGYFRVTYTADERIQADALPDRYTSPRTLSGTIYFLETKEQFSAMHMLPTDEIYYHHLGDPLQMLFLHPDGSGETQILGPDLAGGQHLQIRAPRLSWHGSRPLPGAGHGYSLVSTSMAPGFDISDPVFPSRDELTERYPEFRSLIESLTRLEPHNV